MVNSVLADIACEHAVRGLDSQIAVLTEIRTRANFLMVATTAVATLFGGLLLRESSIPAGITLGAIAPMVVFVIGFGSAVAALRPTGKRGAPGDLTLVASARAILNLGETDAVSARAAAACDLEALWDDNQPVIEGLLNRVRCSAVCLGTQVAFWAALFVVRQLSA